MQKDYKNIITDISAYSAELRKLIPETMMGGGPSLMYAADALRAFDQFSATTV